MIEDQPNLKWKEFSNAWLELAGRDVRRLQPFFVFNSTWPQQMWLISGVFEALTESLMRRGDMSIILCTRGKCPACRGSSKDLRWNTLYHRINTVYDKCVNRAEMGVKHQGVTYCFPDFGHSWDMYRRLSTSLISPPFLFAQHSSCHWPPFSTSINCASSSTLRSMKSEVFAS